MSPALLAQPNDKYPTGVRDRAFMATLLLAGLRCAEAIHGHARITTTQRYLHASIPTLLDKFRAFT